MGSNQFTRGQGHPLVDRNVGETGAPELYINGILAAKEPTTTTAYVLVKLNDDARKAIVPGGRNVLAVHCIDREGGRFIDAGIYIARLTGGQLNNNH
jgi:hypothetical protein